MPNENHIQHLKLGVDHWNRWRLAEPSTVPDLVDADLRAREFDYFDFRGADFLGADLSGSRAINAQFDRARCRGTLFRDARLPDATWVSADLSEALGANHVCRRFPRATVAQPRQSLP